MATNAGKKQAKKEPVKKKIIKTTNKNDVRKRKKKTRYT